MRTTPMVIAIIIRRRMTTRRIIMINIMIMILIIKIMQNRNDDSHRSCHDANSLVATVMMVVDVLKKVFAGSAIAVCAMGKLRMF